MEHIGLIFRQGICLIADPVFYFIPSGILFELLDHSLDIIKIRLKPVLQAKPADNSAS